MNSEYKKMLSQAYSKDTGYLAIKYSDSANFLYNFTPVVYLASFCMHGGILLICCEIISARFSSIWYE